jgi:hypothetical protein
MFQNILQNHNLSNLGFDSDNITWNSNQDGATNSKARLDRMVATPAFSLFYHSASVVHLTRHALDLF